MVDDVRHPARARRSGPDRRPVPAPDREPPAGRPLLAPRRVRPRSRDAALRARLRIGRGRTAGPQLLPRRRGRSPGRRKSAPPSRPASGSRSKRCLKVNACGLGPCTLAGPRSQPLLRLRGRPECGPAGTHQSAHVRFRRASSSTPAGGASPPDDRRRRRSSHSASIDSQTDMLMIRRSSSNDAGSRSHRPSPPGAARRSPGRRRRARSPGSRLATNSASAGESSGSRGSAMLTCAIQARLAHPTSRDQPLPP